MKLPNSRARKRLALQTEIQTAALGLFQAKGFEAVTVEDIADQVGTSASTVYRHFGTKEGIMLWDDLDAPVGKAVMGRLIAGDSARAAIRNAFCTALANGIDNKEGSHLERIRFIYRTPALHGAAMAAELAGIASLAKDLNDLLDEHNAAYAAEVLSGACYGVLNSALHRWVEEDGEVPLSELMSAAFDVLAWER